jgi:hypothetical protein
MATGKPRDPLAERRRGTVPVPSLKEQFAAIPREAAGSRNSNRTDYQKDWALCHLLELHDTGQNYALVVERHDDVVVLDCPVDPERVDFYQLKTKDDGDWRLAKLLHVEKSKADPEKRASRRRCPILPSSTAIAWSAPAPP